MKTIELDLFSLAEADALLDESSIKEMPSDVFGPIAGLRYLPAFINREEQAKIISLIDKAEWSGELARRVQHYGFKYDYKARRINEDMRVGDLPKWLRYLGKRLVEHDVFDVLPDQVIVNEYLPGQGISPHIDCQPCFGDTVASLSLGSTCIMEFTQATSVENIPVLLEPCSVVVLKEDARYLWRHGISKRKQDEYQGQIYRRDRRISLTFRNVKWD